MIVITNDSIFDLQIRPDPKEVAESIGFPPAMNFSTPIPFPAQYATTLEDKVKFSFSERTKKMFWKEVENKKGNGVREMQRRKEPSAKRTIGKRGHGKGAIE
jgi:hypothetical protein